MELTRAAARAASGTQEATQAGLRKATQEFESLFVNQMLQAMRGAGPQSKLLGGGEGEQMFRGMLDSEYAQRISAAGGVGLGEMLYGQLASGLQPPIEVRGGDSGEDRL